MAGTDSAHQKGEHQVAQIYFWHPEDTVLFKFISVVLPQNEGAERVREKGRFHNFMQS